MQTRRLIQNEQGVVLVTGLIFLAILTIVGATAYFTTSNELKTSKNYRTSITALYAAAAGLEEARSRLKGTTAYTYYAGDPAASYNDWWSAYISSDSSFQPSTDDPDYSSSYTNYFPSETLTSRTGTTVTTNSLLTNIIYYVKIRHKREYDAESQGHDAESAPLYNDNDGSTTTHTAASPGNIIYWGYDGTSSPTPFTTSGATSYSPVEILTAYGFNSDAKEAKKVLRAEFRRYPGPDVIAALYSRDDVTVDGNGTVDGNDNCGVMAAAIPPIYTLSPATTSTHGHSYTFGGNPTTAQTGSESIDIASLVDSLKSGATSITDDTTSTPGEYGSATDYGKYYYGPDTEGSSNELKLKVDGYGMLLVDGDLRMKGNFQWHGLILVTGTTVFAGGAGELTNIAGAILSNSTVTIKGTPNILYDSCAVDNAASSGSYSLGLWKFVY